jgi:hypothetical protein
MELGPVPADMFMFRKGTVDPDSGGMAVNSSLANRLETAEFCLPVIVRDAGGNVVTGDNSNLTITCTEPVNQSGKDLGAVGPWTFTDGALTPVGTGLSVPLVGGTARLDLALRQDIPSGAPYSTLYNFWYGDNVDANNSNRYQDLVITVSHPSGPRLPLGLPRDSIYRNQGGF